MVRIEKGSADSQNDWTNWNLAFGFQSKLHADAIDMKIPPWAVPNVNAAWNAIRIRAGKGMCSCKSTFTHNPSHAIICFQVLFILSKRYMLVNRHIKSD